jgi:F-type H+-transporting ATPase subunit epsilon
MPITMHLDIVSAEKEIFSGVVQYVVATGQLGEIGIKPGHAPLLTILKPGLVMITLADGQEMVLYVSGGMLEVQPFYTTILADEVERAEDLDEASALEAKRRAETLMQNKNEKIDFSVAAAELARAVAQIRAIQKIRKQL